MEARWFYSGEGEPVPNVRIEFDERGVAAVHQLSKTLDDDTVVIPGIVNAHTHLELSDVREPFPPGANFPEWIHKVIAHRMERGSEADAFELGLREVADSTTGLVADTIPSDQTFRNPSITPAIDPQSPFAPPHPACVRGIPFVEFIGLDDERVQQAVNYPELPDGAGISPHAPYSVRLDLLNHLVNRACATQAPVMMHLGETLEELELLQHGTGPFADMLQAFGVWEPGLFPQRDLCEYLECLSAAPRVLIAHGNYFGDREIEFLANRPHMSVVYCPRTHQHFGHTQHPWQKMLDAGVNVALGTDSRASNPDLDVWNEAIALRRIAPDVHPRVLLKMLTLNGTQALTGDAPLIQVGDNSADYICLSAPQAVSDFWRLFD